VKIELASIAAGLHPRDKRSYRRGAGNFYRLAKRGRMTANVHRLRDVPNTLNGPGTTGRDTCIVGGLPNVRAQSRQIRYLKHAIPYLTEFLHASSSLNESEEHTRDLEDLNEH
jgi:hypothetical protein